MVTSDDVTIAQIPTFVILLLLLVSPLVVVIERQSRDSMSLEASSYERIHLTDDTEALDKTYTGAEAEKVYLKYDHVVPSEGDPGPSNHNRESWLPGAENLNLLQAMGTIDFWLLFLAMACGMGSGLATVNNISQVGGSLGYTSVQTSTLVSLWSIWNFLGRFGAGYVSDFFLRLRGYPRPLFIAITLGTMSVGHAVIASGLPGSLYAGSVVVGVCYGSQWSLMPTITSEIFGITHMGTIFNTVAVASPIGSYILSVRVVGYIYDLEASGESTCTGTHCFMLSFLIMMCVTIFGSASSLALYYRTRRFYRQVVFETLRSVTAP
ncbi:hypothetical protein Taro_050967 [Colocasia esculenta]|uniref:NFD4 C-terminal domain-containing protein n=1 Tax=Colocasia esculenta TaxID=4460 RepID=A0A843XER5_COLES|nr:hypothetical protein [Colocasia esculenta]